MKTRTFLLGIFLASGSLSFAQLPQKVVFDYDEAGNRISRASITMSRSRSSSPGAEEDTIRHTLLTCRVTVYPNPTEGEVNLSISNGEEEGVSAIQVYDGSGKRLQRLEVKGNVIVPIDLSSYSGGIYLIDFRQGDSQSFYKVIKK